MTKYEQEIVNRFGKKLLANILSDFANGFQIIAVDDLQVIVGDKTSNAAYSRKTFKLKETHVFETTRKMTRKFG